MDPLKPGLTVLVEKGTGLSREGQRLRQDVRVNVEGQLAQAILPGWGEGEAHEDLVDAGPLEDFEGMCVESSHGLHVTRWLASGAVQTYYCAQMAKHINEVTMRHIMARFLRIPGCPR